MRCGDERVLLIVSADGLDPRLAGLAARPGWEVRVRPTPRQLPLRPRRGAEIVVVELAPVRLEECLRLVRLLREHGAQRLLVALGPPGDDGIEAAARAAGAGLYFALGRQGPELASAADRLERLLERRRRMPRMRTLRLATSRGP
jgi:hypothetical protein